MLKKKGNALLKKTNHSGFSLIEMCIVITLGSLMLLGIIMAYKQYVAGNRQHQTAQKLVDIKAALETYFRINGRLPCPARNDIPPTDPQYGRQTAACAAGGLSPVLGIASRNAFVGAALNRVWIGALPVRELGIADDSIANVYGWQYVYAVSQTMVANLPALPDQTRGAVDIRHPRGTNPTMVVPEGSALYLVVDPGSRGIGSRNVFGTQHDLANFSCGMGTPSENENCDGDATFYYGGPSTYSKQ